MADTVIWYLHLPVLVVYLPQNISQPGFKPTWDLKVLQCIEIASAHCIPSTIG